MGDHFNSSLSDAAWMVVFGRWHAGGKARALRAEVGVSHDTWTANAKRLGMRIRDLAENHPARRRSPPFEARPDDWKHPKGLLTEGAWREVFRLRAAGVPDKALSARFGVHVATIATQAKWRGLRKRDLAMRDAGEEPVDDGAGAVMDEGLAGEWGVGDRRLAVAVSLKDPAAVRAAFDARIEVLLARGQFGLVKVMCETRERLERAVFKSPGRSHPAAREGGPPPPEGEGEAGDVFPALVLREAQRAPGGDWGTWLFLGGRGAGKTLAGAAWVAERAEAMGKGGRLALIGATLHDAREVMIGGVSGVMGLARWREAGVWPVYEPSRRRLRFPGGAEAFVFSAEEPERLRGPQFGAAWADEFCAWPRPEETLALLRMGLRLGDGPRLVVTTTPRPIGALRRLRAEAGCVETHAGTKENAAHLAAGFLEGLEALYGGTRRAAQEMEGLVVESEGALFTAEMMMGARVSGAAGWASSSPSGGAEPIVYDRPAQAAERPGGNGRGMGATVCGALGRSHPAAQGGGPPPPEGEGDVCGAFDRVVVGLDPTASVGGDACGIVVVGRRRRADGVREAWVLADRSRAGLSPEGWARRAVEAARDWGAQAIVAEVNQGGDMVSAVLKTAQEGMGVAVPVRTVRAAQGKRARAEPVAALYEQGRVRHAGVFAALEEELMAVGGEDEGRMSLDRADALVWAVSALMLNGGEGPRIRSLETGYVAGGLSAAAPLGLPPYG